jgi:hypothetical protein
MNMDRSTLLFVLNQKNITVMEYIMQDPFYRVILRQKVQVTTRLVQIIPYLQTVTQRTIAA